ncbi:MAG TPA: porin [Luteitalea sp.]|nr:porin [Luteitalea sp.]
MTLALGAPALAIGQTTGLVESAATAIAAVDATDAEKDKEKDAQPGDLPPAQPTTWETIFGPTRISGVADTYYAYNGNRPASGQNILRNFDEKDNQFAVSYLELAAEQVPTADRRVGFRADIGFGPTANWVNSVDPDAGTLRYLQQAYVSVLAPVGRGLQIDAGKFNTPIGAEPTESSNNWNYSRSLLFAWAAPYYHAGIRATLPVSDTVSVSGFVLNGWNNAQDNNRGKTLATQVTWKVLPSLTLSQAWMGGPEGEPGDEDWRNLYDTIATWTVTPKLSLMTNIDIGRDTVDGQTVAWQGVAAYGRYLVNPTWALTPRFEVFEDREGFATGTTQTLREFTLTSEHMLVKNLSIRLEFRRDWSTADFFEYRDTGFKRNQSTGLVGFIYSFTTP